MRRVLRLFAVLAALGLVAGCTGTGTEGRDAGPDDDNVAPGTLKILLANDDGIGHPGIDLMVQRLSAMPDVEVFVVAPARNRSGSSSKTTKGEVSYQDGTTASGVAGVAIDGYPADAVGVAVDVLGLEPHLVVAGINDAQNIGPIWTGSGTLGVVRTAVGRGIPGVAASAGLKFNEDEFGVAADLVVEWIEEHRDQLLAGTLHMDEAVSFNVPTCDPEDMGELREVPLADEFPRGANAFLSDCDLANPNPTNDYEALASGYPAMSRVPVTFPQPRN